MGIQINGQTDIISAIDGSLTVSGADFTSISAGTTSTPSISPTGDSNTGIFFPSADTVCVGTGASEVIRVNSSFNVGINSTAPQTKLDVVGGINGTLVSGTAVSAATTAVDFTGIPRWVKRITVMYSGVSLSSTSDILVQLGDSGGIEATGYVSRGGNISAGTPAAAGVSDSTAGFVIRGNSATNAFNGHMIITLITSTSWVASYAGSMTTTIISNGGGSKTLSTTLDRVRITTANGTDTFDAGTINILYEG